MDSDGLTPVFRQTSKPFRCDRCDAELFIGRYLAPSTFPPGGWAEGRGLLNASNGAPHVCPISRFKNVAEAVAWDAFGMKLLANLRSGGMALVNIEEHAQNGALPQPPKPQQKRGPKPLWEKFEA